MKRVIIDVVSVSLRKASPLLEPLVDCFMACTASCAPALPIEELAKQIRAVGPGQIVLSSDFGQTPNGPPVPGFGRCLVKLHECGVSVADIRTMIVENPARLLLNRRGTL